MKNSNITNTYEANRLITISASKCMSAPYQRETNQTRVNGIIKGFDKNKVKPIVLSFRGGVYHVVDGQHTLSALRRLYGENVMVSAVVLDGLNYEQEAEYYTKQYEGSKRLSTCDTFKSRLEYDKKAQMISNICKVVGFNVKTGNSHSNSKTILAIKQLEKMYDTLGSGGTHYVLALIRDTWNYDKSSLDGNMLSGMTLFYKTYKDKIDKATFISRLSAVSPKEIMRNAKMRIMSSRQAMYAYEIYYIYNKGLKRNKLPDVIR